MNRYPMQPMAQQLQQQGRNGDTNLLHVTDNELQGIAALAPGGRMPINPTTGLPEASFLEQLIPMMVGMGVTVASGGTLSPVGAAIAGGMSSGLATGAITGDWERGLASGVMSAGLGGAMAGPMSGAAGELAAAPELMSETALAGVDIAGGTAGLLPEATQVATTAGTLADGTTGELMKAIQNETASTATSSAGPAYMSDASTFGDPSWTDAWKASPEMANTTFGERAGAIFSPGSGLGKELTAKEHLMPMAMGMGAHMQMDTQEKWEKKADKLAGKNEKARQEAEERMMAAYRRAQPNLPWEGYADGGIVRLEEGGFTGRFADAGKYGVNVSAMNEGIQLGLRGKHAVNPTDLHYSDDQYEPWGEDDLYYRDEDLDYADSDYFIPESWYNDKGEIRKKKQDEFAASGGRGVLRAGAVKSVPKAGATMVPREGVSRVLKPDAVGVSMNPNYRGGYDPEFDFFQDDPNNVQVPESTDWTGVYKPWTGDLSGTAKFGQLGPTGAGKPFDPSDPNATPPDDSWVWSDLLKIWTQNNMGPNLAAGGQIRLAEGGIASDMGLPMMQNGVAPGGISDVPTQYNQPPQQQAQPTEQDVQMVAAALTGEVGDQAQADQIIDMFIQKFGNEVFTMVRKMILQSMEPNAQTEGMIQGQGGGMDDMVHGSIAGNPQQPVALSPGEFVVPADVVSGLGDGSSDAGAAELDGMMERVRMARGGNTTQPPPFDARKVLPR